MKLYEYKAKELLSRHGIPVPKGMLVRSSKELERLDFPAAIKAQVLVGGRGKAGGIKFADDLDQARKAIDSILGMEIGGYKVKQVLVEQRLDIEKEFYLSVTIDRAARAPLLMASAEGGVDIEDVPDEKIFKKHLSPFIGISPYILRAMKSKLQLSKEITSQIGGIVPKLYETFREEDAELVEINPLILTREGDLIAGDAKITIEDNALYRHPEYKGLEEDLTPLEKEAKESGIAFIQLGGNIGVIANGAGLTMATLDVLNLKGGKPGVFLDLGGTDDPEQVKRAFFLMQKAEPDVIFLNIFGGITKCDTVALGVKEAIRERGIDIPVVARIKGLNEERAREILREEGIVPVQTIEEGAEEATRLAGG